MSDLDDVLDGLIPGDNVVWSADRGAPLDRFFEKFLSEGRRRGSRCVLVRTASGKPDLGARNYDNIDIFDALPGGALSEPAVLEEALIETARKEPHTYIAIASFDALASRWGADRAVAFFRRCCPRLFDASAVVYWGISRSKLDEARIRQIAQVAQCCIELGTRQMRLTKADGRPATTQGRVLRLHATDGRLRLANERALDRLARGLEAIRHEHHMSQADLARLAGVTPSAISQAEAGRRGLSLDTLLALTDGLGIGLDDLLHSRPTTSYEVGRRVDASEPVTTLFANSDIDIRLYAVRLAPGQTGTPPFPANGTEMVAVAHGLVHLAVGDEAPVLRTGEAIMATQGRIHQWRNLLAEPSLLFWILAS